MLLEASVKLPELRLWEASGSLWEASESLPEASGWFREASGSFWNFQRLPDDSQKLPEASGSLWEASRASSSPSISFLAVDVVPDVAIRLRFRRRVA